MQMSQIEESQKIKQYIEECNNIRDNLVYLPKEIQPQTRLVYTYHRISVESFEPAFPAPPNINRKNDKLSIGSDSQVTKLQYSISVTLFYRKARRFYGSTYIGSENDCCPSNNSNFEEHFYFRSNYEDPECFAVVEMICTCYSVGNDGLEKTKPYGCGWSLIPLSNVGEHLVTPVFKGTPIKLLLSRSVSSLSSFEKSECSLKYSLAKDEARVKQLLSNLCEVNCIVGEASSIPGIVLGSWNKLNEGGTGIDHCDQNLVTLQLKDIRIHFPSGSTRETFEQDLMQFVRNGSDTDVVDKKQTFLTFTKQRRQDTQAVQLVSRKMKVFVHNTHVIVDQFERDLYVDNTNPSVVHCNDVDMNIINHPKYALILQVLYIFCFNNKNVIRLKGRNTEQVVVNGGYVVLFPNFSTTKHESINASLWIDSASLVFNDSRVLHPKVLEASIQTIELKLYRVSYDSSGSNQDLTEREIDCVKIDSSGPNKDVTQTDIVCIDDATSSNEDVVTQKQIVSFSSNYSSDSSYSNSTEQHDEDHSTIFAPSKNSLGEEQDLKFEGKDWSPTKNCGNLHSYSYSSLTSEEKRSSKEHEIFSRYLSSDKHGDSPTIQHIKHPLGPTPLAEVQSPPSNTILKDAASIQDVKSLDPALLSKIQSPVIESIFARRVLELNDELLGIVKSLQSSTVKNMMFMFKNSALPSWSKSRALKESFITKIELYEGDNEEETVASLIIEWYQQETRTTILEMYIRSHWNEA